MAQSIVAVIVGLLGLHMLRAAQRHRALAEAWIGLFFVASGVGGESAMRAFQETDPALAKLLMSIGAPALATATVAGYAFIYTVFRRGETWARLVVLAGSLLVLWGAWYQLVGPTGSPDLTALRVEFLIGRFACFAWGTYEALRAYAMANRRLSFGMADPVVVNRFLLFGIWFAAMGIMPMTLALTRLYGSAGALALANGVGPKVIGSVMAIALVLTFFPPRKYLQWVTAATNGAST